MAPPTILIADNDQDFLESRSEYFQRHAGYIVRAAYSLAQALQLFEQGGIDLAILDLRLLNDEDDKDMSGVELAVQAAPRVPKIILTSYPTVEAVRKALGIQFNGTRAAMDVVPKQDGPQALLTVVQKVLQCHAAADPTAPAAPLYPDVVGPDGRIDTAALRRALVESFDLEELNTLCSDLGVAFDRLGGQGIEAKARELIGYFQRRKQLDRLVAEIRRSRGGII